MSEEQIGNLAYLVLMAVVIASYFLIANRRNLGQVVRQAALWGLIFIGAIAAAGLWEDIRRDVTPRQAVFTEAGRIEVPRASDGHYYVTAHLNDRPVIFVVDTGATDIVLTRQDARLVGIDPDALIYSGRAGTANGTVDTARAVVDIFDVDGLADRDVSVWINRGEMNTSLLGMAYLQRFARIEIANGKLILER